jgi:hypothetical protein
MDSVTRRRFTTSATAAVGGLAGLTACSQESGPDSYEAAVAQTWRAVALPWTRTTTMLLSRWAALPRTS